MNLSDALKSPLFKEIVGKMSSGHPEIAIQPDGTTLIDGDLGFLVEQNLATGATVIEWNNSPLDISMLDRKLLPDGETPVICYKDSPSMSVLCTDKVIKALCQFLVEHLSLGGKFAKRNSNGFLHYLTPLVSLKATTFLDSSNFWKKAVLFKDDFNRVADLVRENEPAGESTEEPPAPMETPIQLTNVSSANKTTAHKKSLSKQLFSLSQQTSAILPVFGLDEIKQLQDMGFSCEQILQLSRDVTATQHSSNVSHSLGGLNTTVQAMYTGRAVNDTNDTVETTDGTDLLES